MTDDLRSFRQSRGIPAKDMVAVVREIYPKYDKTIQSKCENGDVYGIQLRPDAMAALLATFPPEATEAPHKPKKERHRLTCRVTARLGREEHEALQQHLKADGVTMQQWLISMVREYLASKEGGQE